LYFTFAKLHRYITHVLFVIKIHALHLYDVIKMSVSFADKSTAEKITAFDVSIELSLNK